MSRYSTAKYLKKSKFPLQQLYLAVSLLVVLAVGSSTWTSTTMAKYVSSASGSDSARVAAFVVNASGQANETLILDVNEPSVDYTFSVTNAGEKSVSQVTVDYDVTVKFPSALSNVTLTLKKGDAVYTGTTTDNLTYIFQNVGTFQPGVSRTDTLTLVFTRGSGDAAASWSNISVTVNATQQD